MSEWCIDDRPVIVEHERKSVGCEQTFLEDLTLRGQLIIELYHTVMELVERIEKSGFKGKTLTLKVKYSDFSQITRSTTGNQILSSKDTILPLAKSLLQSIEFSPTHPIRLLGLSVSNPSQKEKTGPRWIEGWLPLEW